MYWPDPGTIWQWFKLFTLDPRKTTYSECIGWIRVRSDSGSNYLHQIPWKLPILIVLAGSGYVLTVVQTIHPWKNNLRWIDTWSKISPSPSNELLHKECKSLISIAKWRIYCINLMRIIRIFLLLFINVYWLIYICCIHGSMRKVIKYDIDTYLEEYYIIFAWKFNTSTLLFLLYWVLLLCDFQWWMHKVIWAFT